MTNSPVIETVQRLLPFFIVVPACKPTSNGGCSAPWHKHAPKDAGKVPLVSGYPQFAAEPPTAEQCLAFFHDVARVEVNLGIVVPRGVVVLDADSPEAGEELGRFLPADFVTPMRTARPGRGPCWILRLPAGVDVQTAVHKGDSKAVDILAPGRFFVVPDSLHVSGHVHRWEVGRAPWEVPVTMAPPTMLEAIIRWTKRDEKPTPRHRSPQVPLVRSLEGAARADVEHGLRLIRARTALGRAFRGIKAHGDVSASGKDFSFAQAALKEGLKPAVVAALLRERPGLHRDDDAYVEQTVLSALSLLRRAR